MTYYEMEREKQEAIYAGNRALNSLRAAQANLNRAKDWGLFDMFGGGFFSTWMKNSRMDDARRDMEQAQEDLRIFSRELQDINMFFDLKIETGDFLSFADWFMDNIFIDWMIQDRIKQASDNVAHAISYVEEMLRQLQ